MVSRSARIWAGDIWKLRTLMVSSLANLTVSVNKLKNDAKISTVDNSTFGEVITQRSLDPETTFIDIYFVPHQPIAPEPHYCCSSAPGDCGSGSFTR